MVIFRDHETAHLRGLHAMEPSLQLPDRWLEQQYSFLSGEERSRLRILVVWTIQIPGIPKSSRKFMWLVRRKKTKKKLRQKRYFFGKPWSDDWIYIGFSCRLPLPRVQIWEISALTPISWGSMLLLQLIWSPCDFSFHFGLLFNPVYFAMISINHDLSNSRLINQFIVQRNSCGAP